MTTLDRLGNIAAGIAIAAISSSAGLLDDLTAKTGLSATVLLLITIAAFIAVALGVVGYMSMREVSDSETYRTVCRTTMDRDLATIRKRVPHTVPRKVNLHQTSGCKDAIHINDGRRFKVVDREEEFKATADRVRKDGSRAGDREFETGIREANPHQKPSRWHVLWLTSREAKLMERQVAQAASESGVHTNTHAEA
ncbi:MAG: hypothetical protein Q8N13_11005 [Acidovorax sp.]|nr:hypothetical protein [Acidovorax sp.]